jgi:hypothetical protein
MQAEAKVHDGRADFNFLMGDWQVHNRRLRERLKGSTAWEEFDGQVMARPILGGLGNFDEVTFNRATGVGRGATLRLFDIASQQWRIYWADGTRGELDVPMVGSFVNGRGEFYAQELFEGKAIFSRFIWTVLSRNTCRWEQAFSPDGGKTWETNWTGDFTRIK